MIPTNRLRFVERNVYHVIGRSEHGDTVYTEVKLVLQQWWEVPGHFIHDVHGYITGVVDGKGEWRDIPVEQE